MSNFLHDAANDNAKAIAIPWVFSENSRAKNELAALNNFSPRNPGK